MKFNVYVIEYGPVEYGEVLQLVADLKMIPVKAVCDRAPRLLTLFTDGCEASTSMESC